MKNFREGKKGKKHNDHLSMAHETHWNRFNSDISKWQRNYENFHQKETL